jgi:hypothetical protein
LEEYLESRVRGQISKARAANTDKHIPQM